MSRATADPVASTFVVVKPGAVGYPPRLCGLGLDQPLWVRGAMPIAGSAVAIVGARAAGAAAMARAHALAKHLAARAVHIVSGGALGIDGAAHRGALAGGGTTTVVLGSGVDVAYPVRHAPLFDEVVARGGGLVSMLPPGTEPRRSTFVQRNPLIAALADVVIVVEANVRSGSLSTARAAARLGRVVCAWPGSAGCDRLLASGTAIVESEDDVFAALAGTPRLPPRAPRDPIEARVHAAIEAGARGVDAIVSATGLSVRDVLRAVARMS
jgi:DNA processing protein